MGAIAKLANFQILTILCICGLTIELKIFEETCVSITKTQTDIWNDLELQRKNENNVS